MSRPDFDQQRRAMADTLALGFTASGLLGLLAILLPAPESLDALGTASLALAALAVAALVYLTRRRLVLAACHSLLLLASAMIAMSIVLYGDPITDNELLYVFVGAYAFYFFAVAEAAAHVVVALVAYGLAASSIAGGQVEPTSLLLLGGTMTTVGLMTRMFGARARALVGELAALATTDSLTGLLNRRGLQRLVDAELRRSARTGRPFCLLIGDLDHFKRVNDRLGHMGGDMALERSAAVLERERRATDSVARIGGEEFAVLLPECDLEGAVVVAERMRTGLAEALASGPAGLTISLGAASHPAHGGSWEELLRSADRALYAAKDSGRNRVVVYEPEAESRFEGAG